MIVGKRIECPWCPGGTVRADLLCEHLCRDHGAGTLEADEVTERLRLALNELPTVQAVAYAFTGMRLPPLDARELLADMRRDARAAVINSRPKRKRHAWTRPPDGYGLCFGCLTVKPARDMATKANGEPAVICLNCHRILDNFRVPKWARALV